MADTLTVYVSNTAEVLLPCILESEVENELDFLHRLGDRSAMWRGVRKLLVTSVPIPNLGYWERILGLRSLTNVWPIQPSASLCHDVLRETDLLSSIVANCAQAGTVDLIPYGATPQFYELIDHLEPILKSVGIALDLPETPERTSLSLSQHFGTKTGFRHLMAEWFGNELPRRIPEGYVTTDIDGIQSVVKSFLIRGKGCICKPSAGVSGLGQVRFLPDSPMADDLIIEKLLSEPYMKHMPVIVEELIPSDLSPSSEAYVPKPNIGQTQLTYYCTQLFSDRNYFAGVLIDRNCIPRTIEQQMSNCIHEIGARLQDFGYAGIFDVDFALDRRDGTLYLLEANLRRTGGTHVHEAATLLFGDDYVTKRTILSSNKVELPCPMDWNELSTRIDSIMFPIGSLQEGIIITHMSSLPFSTAYMVLGQTLGRVELLQEMFQAALRT